MHPKTECGDGRRPGCDATCVESERRPPRIRRRFMLRNPASCPTPCRAACARLRMGLEFSVRMVVQPCQGCQIHCFQRFRLTPYLLKVALDVSLQLIVASSPDCMALIDIAIVTCLSDQEPFTALPLFAQLPALCRRRLRDRHARLGAGTDAGAAGRSRTTLYLPSASDRGGRRFRHTDCARKFGRDDPALKKESCLQGASPRHDIVSPRARLARRSWRPGLSPNR